MMYFCGPSMPWPRTVIASPEASWVTMKRTTRTDRDRALGRLDQVRDEEEADRRVAQHVGLEAVALEHVVERDEDRDLEDQRQARGQRIDLVLLVELHHLLLLTLLVVLVLRPGSP